jgi:exodeoxyribonuclease V beta subunit
VSNPPTPAALDVFAAPLAGVNLIEASAGTGKTWTICGLYLRLLLERELTVQQILVVTFTNAATAELRERIRARLLELLTFLHGASLGAADPFVRQLADDLLQRLGKPKQDLTARLELALHSFDEAAIFTIHGFCQRALADNPFAAGLPMRTELVQSDRALLLEAAHDFWRRHVAHACVTPEFARYLHARGDTPDVYAGLLQRHLAKPLARLLWPAALHDPPMSVSALHQPYQAARAQWLTHKDAICTLLGASLGALNGNTYKTTTLLDAAAQWDALCRDDDPLTAVGDKAHLFRDSELAAKTKKNCTTPSHAFFGHAETYLSLRERLDRSLFLARCRQLERLFEEGSVQLQTLKRSRHVVAFNDMLANLHERLQHPDYPWLAASIRARFPAALIDEFQDTDPLQLAIFRKIYDTKDSLVFLVGDPKQAIYSFRHADLHSYLRATRWADRQWSLTDNQRSSRRLLAGLNRLFGANGAAFVLPQVQYRPVEYGAKSRAPFVDDSAARAPLQVWRLPDRGGELPKARAKQAAVEATAAEIARLLTASLNGQITLDGRPLRPGDIAVLVRSRSLGGGVKRALASLRVGAVELSRDSIFGSPEARDLETVLTAIAAPARETLLRAALATEIFGCDAPQIEHLTAGETRLPRWVLQFMEYRELWVKRGFGVMVRQLFTDQAVAKRLLAQADGERRLTNCLHLAEELQQAAESNPSPEALLRYFRAAQAEENPVDTAQLRLESDQNLVQIVTIHTCKGLEYPIVFCPFLCDGGTKFGGPGVEGHEYHDSSLLPVIDFDDHADDPPALAIIKERIKLEQAAETVRLIYVALTRAVHRCYLVIGPYQTRSPKDESARSMLNWLVAGGGGAPAAWFASKLSTQDLDAAWGSVAAASGGALVIDPLPTAPGVPLPPAAGDAAALSTAAAPGTIAPGWRLSSYSGLSYGARSESAAGDHDARTIVTPAWGPPSAEIALDDILRFPRGPAAGDCIHAVFENIDFTACSGWGGAIAAALSSHPPGRVEDPRSLPAGTLNRMLLRLLEDVTAATLIPGLYLASVPMQRRLTELEFNLPVPHLSAAALNSTLKALGYEVPSLSFGALEGYLKGFIDLVFEHQGRYFILDWKSNHLGYTPADYGGAALARAMAEHGYHLQYLLYAVALDRYLRLRVPNYRYDTHFGGVLYLFVRGVRPNWRRVGDATPGVFFHRPAGATLRTLNQLLGSPHAAAVN